VRPFAAALVLLATLAHAEVPGQHPYYLHARSDLRAVRWMLRHRPGDTTVSANEELAIAEINKAIGAIKPAAIDDGKNIEDHPSVDLPPDNPRPPAQGAGAADLGACGCRARGG